MSDTDGHGSCFGEGNKFTTDPKNCFPIGGVPERRYAADRVCDFDIVDRRAKPRKKMPEPPAAPPAPPVTLYNVTLEAGRASVEKMRQQMAEEREAETKKACDEAVRQATMKLQARLEEMRNALEVSCRLVTQSMVTTFFFGCGVGAVAGSLITGLIWAIKT